MSRRKKGSSKLGVFNQAAQLCRISLEKSAVSTLLQPWSSGSVALLCNGASQKRSVPVKPGNKDRGKREQITAMCDQGHRQLHGRVLRFHIREFMAAAFSAIGDGKHRAASMDCHGGHNR
jgi:hypothetical protein